VTLNIILAGIAVAFALRFLWPNPQL